MTAARLRTLRAAILTAATPDARATAARAYLDAVGKAPVAERLLAHLADALGRRYSACELERIQDAVDEARTAAEEDRRASAAVVGDVLEGWLSNAVTCFDRKPDAGFTCTRRRLHDGQHVATSHDGRVTAVWVQDAVDEVRARRA